MFEIQEDHVSKTLIVALMILALMENVSKLVKTIMTVLTKNIVKMISAYPRYVKSIVSVALETNVLKKHVLSNVNQSMIVQMQRSVLTIFVLFLEGDHVMQNQVTSNFM